MRRLLLIATLLLAVVPPRAQARTTVSLFSEAIIVTTDEGYVGPIDTPGDVGRAIEACWRPPHAGDQVTVRVSFRRDGSVFGTPFVTFKKALAAGPTAGAELTTSIEQAVARCAPLPFTRRFGAAVAGQVFLIRFIALRAGAPPF